MSLRSEIYRIVNQYFAGSKKISELPPVVSVGPTDLVEVSQGGVSKSATASQFNSGAAGLQSVQAGTNITVDNTDPLNPIISSTGGGGSQTIDEVLDTGSVITETRSISSDSTSNNLVLGADESFDNKVGAASLVAQGLVGMYMDDDTNNASVTVDNINGTQIAGSGTGNRLAIQVEVHDNSGPGTSGQVYTSNGTSGPPTWEDASSGGGAVDSVNGETGVVVLNAADVGADASGSAAAVQTNLDNHINDTTAAHAASAISNTPSGNIAATTVQAAINELDSEKMTNPMTTQGDIIYGGASGAPTRLAAGTANQILGMNSGATAPEYKTQSTGSAFTKTDDTNVTVTLGGSHASAVVNAMSIALGWTGQLAISRGGTGTSSPFVKSIFRSVTATTTLAVATDWVLTANATGGAITVNLPAVSGIADGTTFLVIRTNSGANAVTLDGNASETINGSTTFALSAQYAYAWIMKVGSEWIIIGST